jgi:hypothetical protein
LEAVACFGQKRLLNKAISFPLGSPFIPFYDGAETTQ